jgi:hypothetical protein
MRHRRLMVSSVAVLLLSLAACINDPNANLISYRPDKAIFDHAVSAMEGNRFDVARMTLQTLLNTYPIRSTLTGQNKHYKILALLFVMVHGACRLRIRPFFVRRLTRPRDPCPTRVPSGSRCYKSLPAKDSLSRTPLPLK